MTERRATEEQEVYARWLAVGVRVGFAALLASFVIYATGMVAPAIAPQELHRYWGLPVAEYVRLTGAPTGWGWIRRLGQSDFMNFVGVAILGSTTIVCYLRVLPIFVRGRNRAFAYICIAEIAVLVAAASGMIFSQH